MLVALTLGLQRASAASEARWVFCCSSNNDLHRFLTASLGQAPPRFDSPAEAVAQAPEGAGLLILADGYPAQTTVVEPAVLERAAAKRLRIYLEYPASLPDLAVDLPRDAGKERLVVAFDLFGSALPPMSIATVNGCRYVPIKAGSAHLVLARVAGVDVAVFGLKDTPTQPILFDHPRGDLLVASTKLSDFVTGRFMPTAAWRIIWQTILQRLQPETPLPELRWVPTVRPSFGPEEALPPDAEPRALRRSADWIANSRVLRHRDWPAPVLDWSRTYNSVHERPRAEWPAGDGSFGLLEGYSSTIYRDGSQPMRYAVRNDNMTEVAMLLASDAATQNRPANARVATNLLHYLFTESGLAGGPRSDPAQASYGLIGWAVDSPDSYWGDDNASNAEYGTRETSLIQANGDPICDLLYTCNFALIGLHEAAAATGEPLYREAEDRLARFLCRVQLRSLAHPELDGAWYRAFNFRRWEYWASNADWEWGPWCTETGWTQPWIAGTLALRERRTCLWDLPRKVKVQGHFDRLRPLMLPDDILVNPESLIQPPAK